MRSHKEVQGLALGVVPIVAGVGDLHKIGFKPTDRLGEIFKLFAVSHSHNVVCTDACIKLQTRLEEGNAKPIKHVLAWSDVAVADGV